MRLSVLLLATTSILAGGAVLAQAPVPQRPGGGPAAAGAVPPLSQGSTVPALSEQDPARPPGSKADPGTTLPAAGSNSGTTTFYAPTKEEAAVQWPCPQPKVSSISAGTIWSGPDITNGKDWDQDNDVAALAQRLASRRTSLKEADTLIKDFAEKAGPQKDKKLTKLFVGVLDITNENRDQILQGIMRYARGLERLAERMREESDKISEAQENATATGLGVAVDERNRDFAWDQRIFTERKQALSYVCEAPSLLERRVYEIAKRIQARI